MTEYLFQNWVEIAGAVLSVIYLYLSIREKSALWIFGFISSLLYIFVFFESKLYADMSLSFYYLGVSIFGWITWQQKTTQLQDTKLHITRISGKKQLLQYVLGTLIAYLAYYLILQYLTDSTIPAADSVVGALSVIATWMLAKKKIENWLIWIVVDAFAAGLYFYKELYPTAILFVIYTVMAVVGYKQWKKTLNSSK
ncbi:MAG: nicotinamide mononucleotide transporter [Paludibacteraceae bacterium]|nr:nicotinamide mononucleotide transporter [Paludibacteraceae bacterium]